MVQTSTIVVARADLVGSIELHERLQDPVRVGAGDRIQVKLLFNYVEVSKKRDDFRLELTSRLGDIVAEPAMHAHKDLRGLHDDQQGYIMQEYTAPDRPGDHTLTFIAKVVSTDDGLATERSVGGSVNITVE